jgi:Type I restriction modification DNA specificity domain
MSRWPQVPLKAFCQFSGGGKLKLTKRDYMSSGFPAFSAAGQDGNVARWEFDRPGIVVSSIGARCGKAFLANGKWTSLANTYCVLPDIANVEIEYLWYLLNDEASWDRSGSAQPFIKPSDIQNRRVPLPPLGEQRRIVDILNRANGIRRLRREALDKARRLIPALFVDLFGDPATNSRGWPVKKFAEGLQEVEFGISAALSKDAEKEPGKTAVIRIANLTPEGQLNLDETSIDARKG